MAEARHKILFVDDTSDTRALVEFALQQDGFAVAAVGTAEEGLRQARENSFALILLDIGLPDKDGLELCREIRRFDEKTPVLFYTAFADLLDDHEAMRAGAQGALRKPE
ncbi:MAG: response regulator, partial [Acidobacteriota bacterium]|nr:response regulator [Acidobacteriota bacterium]